MPFPVRLAMAAYLSESVAEVLKEKWLLAKRPGPGVARLRLHLNDLEMTGKSASAAPPPPHRFEKLPRMPRAVLRALLHLVPRACP